MKASRRDDQQNEVTSSPSPTSLSSGQDIFGSTIRRRARRSVIYKAQAMTVSIASAA
jgi:hypothetical protein